MKATPGRKKIFSILIAFAMAVTALAPVMTDTASAKGWKPSKSQLRNARIVFDVLQDNGYSTAAACGILGNIQLESGMKPNITGGGYGLCQWTGGRAGSLRNMSAHSSARTQAKFIVKEMKSLGFGSGWTLKKFKQTTSYSKATSVFCIYYERPGIRRMAARTAYAKSYYYILKKPGRIKLVAKKGAFKVKMPKKNSYITGYQIAYKKSGKKTWKKVKTKKIYRTFYKMGSKKLYRVKVRTYTKIDGKYFYGNWSKVKKIRTKAIPKKKKKKTTSSRLNDPLGPTEEATPLEEGMIPCKLISVDMEAASIVILHTTDTGETEYTFANVPTAHLEKISSGDIDVGDSIMVHFTGSLTDGTHQFKDMYLQQPTAEPIPLPDPDPEATSDPATE